MAGAPDAPVVLPPRGVAAKSTPLPGMTSLTTPKSAAPPPLPVPAEDAEETDFAECVGLFTCFSTVWPGRLLGF